MEYTLLENYASLKAVVQAMDADFSKFTNKRVKASANRVRNNLLTCKKLCDTIRKQLLEDVKEIPMRKKSTKKDDTLAKEDNVKVDAIGGEEVKAHILSPCRLEEFQATSSDEKVKEEPVAAEVVKKPRRARLPKPPQTDEEKAKAEEVRKAKREARAGQKAVKAGLSEDLEEKSQ